MNKTFLVIKPSAKAQGKAIIAYWLTTEFPRSKVKASIKNGISIMMSDLRKMYPNTPDPLMGQIMTEMLSQPLTVICFTSLSPEISVVNLLAELRGADMDPRKCKKGTLRRTLGDELGVDPIKIEGGKFTYIPNFIHVPMNSDEAYLCEQIFGPHFAP